MVQVRLDDRERTLALKVPVRDCASMVAWLIRVLGSLPPLVTS